MDPDKRAFVLSRLAAGSPLRAAYLDERARGWTSLMQAVVDGDESAVAREIAAGADVDAIAERARTPLTLACAAGHEAIVARLLAAGAEPNVCTRHNTTLLHLAAAHATSLVRRLLDVGVRVAADRNGMSPLVAAIEYDRLDTVALLLGAPMADRHADGAFAYACARGRLAAMRLLCDRFGAGLATSTQGPLVAAVLGDQLEAVRFILDAGADIDLYDLKDERSALMHAAEAGHHDVAALLLARGADPDSQTEWFVTAPRIAIQRGDTRMFELLRAHGSREPAPPPDHRLSIMQEARLGREADAAALAPLLATDDVAAVAALVAAGLRVNPALLEAAGADAVHTVAYLLACGAKPEPDRWGAVQRAIAVSAGHVVRMFLDVQKITLTNEIAAAAVDQPDPWLLADLLAAGMPADCRHYGPTVINDAAWRGRWRHVELLLDHGASLADDINGECPLSRAAAQGHTRCVAVLAAREAPGRVVTADAYYPKPYAGMRRLDHALLEAAAHPRTIAVLLRHGADPEACMRDGESLLHRGASQAASITLHLQLAGKYLHTPGRHGRTPLFGATIAGNLSVLAALLAAGAQVDARDSDGQTPLHIAALYPRAGILDALLAAGADPHARDNNGRTPLAWAEAALASAREPGLLAATVDRLRAIT